MKSSPFGFQSVKVIALAATDVARAQHFYSETLQLEEDRESTEEVGYRIGESVLIIRQYPPTDDPNPRIAFAGTRCSRDRKTTNRTSGNHLRPCQIVRRQVLGRRVPGFRGEQTLVLFLRPSAYRSCAEAIFAMASALFLRFGGSDPDLDGIIGRVAAFDGRSKRHCRDEAHTGVRHFLRAVLQPAPLTIVVGVHVKNAGISGDTSNPTRYT